MRQTLIALLTTFALWPGTLFAQDSCTGRDLRQTLSADERSALAEALNGVPYAEGNHWIATRGDSVIHLIGTMHLGDPRFEPVLQRLRPVIEAAQTVLLEATPEEEDRLQTALASDPGMLLLQDKTLPELLDDDDWQTLAQAASARGIPSFMAAKFQPWYLSVLLAIPPCAMAALTERNGLDARIIDIATAQGITMRALEPFDTVFEAFATAPLETQIEMMLTGLADPQASEDQFATLLAGYFDETHAAGWELTRILSYRNDTMAQAEIDAAFDEIEDKLLVERNRNWIPLILSATDASPVVVAVGAAHFHGENGVLRLLEQEGYRLERGAF